MIAKYKNWILGVALIGVSFLTYWYFSGPADSAIEEVGYTQTASALLSNQVIALLAKLNAAAGKINSPLLNDPVFQSLRDTGVSVPVGNPGRPNPFAPFAGASESTIKTP